MDKWQEVWNKKDRVNDYVLDTLIKADGFDSGAGSFNLEDWKNYTNEHFQKLDIDVKDSIYDIGCGSGAFVYPLYLENHKVGGIDYSYVLIDLANTVMKESDFVNMEASKIDINKKYDIVVSHSVFHYFKDLDYAKNVVNKMIDKANHKIGIFDINDKSKEAAYHKTRMGKINKEEYEKKYAGLEHLFYEKSWFENLAKELGLKITIFDQTFENYSNSSLRFNVIMEK